MRIGVYARVPRRNGGVFQYTLTLLEMARGLDGPDEFVVLRGAGSDVPPQAEDDRWSNATLPRRWMDRLQDAGLAAVGDEWARRVWYCAGRLNARSVVRDPGQQPRFDAAAERWYRERGIELVIYPVRSELAFETRVPAIVTVHDLNHRRHPDSAEAAALGEFERREFYFRNVCRHAATILVESEESRDDLLAFYADTGVTRDRVMVLPMLPQPAVTRHVSEADRWRVRERYGLRGPFLFYPAQFWPHKNHGRLVDALHRLREASGLTPRLLLSGGYYGAVRRRTFRAAMERAERLGVAGQVRYVGFMPEDDLAPIYQEATALVIPTLFEGANLPVLEAFTTGCPVITSDIRGIREQTAGAAVLVDPHSVEAIADGIRRVLTGPGEREALIQRGRRVAATYTPAHYRQRLRQAIDNAAHRVTRS